MLKKRSGKNRNRQVLILDDDPQHGELLALALSDRGAEVFPSNSPRELFNLLQDNNAIHVVVTDMVMKNAMVDGFTPEETGSGRYTGAAVAKRIVNLYPNKKVFTYSAVALPEAQAANLKAIGVKHYTKMEMKKLERAIMLSLHTSLLGLLKSLPWKRISGGIGLIAALITIFAAILS